MPIYGDFKRANGFRRKIQSSKQITKLLKEKPLKVDVSEFKRAWSE